MNRSQRVDRGAQLVFATAGSAIVFVVTFVLAVVGVIGAGLPLLAALATAGFGYALKRTLS
jgi:hypothetical protein